MESKKGIYDSYGGPIDTSSNKSRLAGRSSMEYELFALHNMLPNLLFLKEFLEELGYPQESFCAIANDLILKKWNEKILKRRKQSIIKYQI